MTFENNMSEMIKSSLDGVKNITDSDMSIGNAIYTPSGVTLIPISKISIGIASGGIDYNSKRNQNSQNFGGGGTTGVSVTPVAFLTVDKNSKIDLITLAEKKDSDISRFSALFERSPEIIEKIKKILS